MDNTFEHAWLHALEQRFGVRAHVVGVKPEPVPRMLVYYFNDYPAKGMLTAVTCGLSNAEHPNWKFGKPELMFALHTQDPSWGDAAALLAQNFYGKHAFSYQSLFRMDGPMAADTDMTSCFVYKPPFLEGDQLKFELADRTIFLAAMYPLHDEEVTLYESIGMQEFWNTPGYEYLNPRRASLANKQGQRHG
jgi:hypothetical protein